jgi:hypothetical protein
MTRVSVRIALYCAPGTEKTRPLSKSASAVFTRNSGSSHMKLSPRLTSIRWWNSVLVKPGHSAITVTPFGLYSLCAHSLKLFTHALVAE